jgi:hypothetical protein
METITPNEETIMAGRLPEEQTLLEKTLWIISSIIRVEQIQVALTWIRLYRKRLRELYKKEYNIGQKDIDLPHEVYERLDNKIREYGRVWIDGDIKDNRQRQGKSKLDVNRLSNHYRLRDKIESWEKRKKVGQTVKKG